MRRGSNTTRSNVSSSFQSTHSITECDFRLNVKNAEATISIHALHYRVRQRLLWYQNDGGLFQSTHSITECDKIANWELAKTLISIHALHYRVRPNAVAIKPNAIQFQSTHSITECDCEWQYLTGMRFGISIHALHYRVRPQHIVVYSAILLVAAKNFCAIQVQ